MQESQIEDFLEQNPDLIEEGLKVIERQKRVSNGIIDLFCQDRDDKYVIIELKLKPSHAAIAQVAKYLLSLQKQGIPKSKLRGVLVTTCVDDWVKQLCDYFDVEIKELTINESRLPNSDFDEFKDGYYTSPEEERLRDSQIKSVIEEHKLLNSEARVPKAILAYNNRCRYPTYDEISKSLKLSKACLRGYLSSLASKGVPLVIRKNKNNEILLRIHYEKLPNFKPYDPLEPLNLNF